MRIFPILLVFAFFPSAWAQQDQETAAAAAKACAAVKDLPVPTVTPQSDDEKNWLSGIDCGDGSDQYDYDNLNTVHDFARARVCALSGLSSDKDNSELFQDPDLTTLVVIYANGDGIPRNVDLAIHFLCMGITPFVPAVLGNLGEQRAKLIAELEKSKTEASPRRYTLCSIGGGLPLDRSKEYGCAEAYDEDLQRQRLAHLTELASHWTEAQKAAFNAVIKAHDAYADAAQSSEAFTGTGVGYSMLEAEDDVNNEFATDIDRFEQGKLPGFTHQEYLDADKALNASYRGIMADNSADGSQVNRPNLIAAERAWLGYRDAFVAFAKLRWPQVSADSWLTFLTKERMARFSKIGI